MTSNIWLFLPILAVFAACEKDCPPVVQDDPCAFDEAQVQAAFGKPYGVPRALDLTGDGAIQGDDFSEWIKLCHPQ